MQRTHPKVDFNDEDYWKRRLTELQYKVLREKGTEPAFTGKLLKEKGDGTFYCAGCDQPLFDSETKFKSGSGWPSFYDVVKEGNIKISDDKSHDMDRIEVICSNCGGHLGHVFDDGPKETGKRYCVNSAALTFRTKKEKK
ncbi:peptide-methionine (R)-S-oxide reductase MsrB [Patescibacteria group bacterium]